MRKILFIGDVVSQVGCDYLRQVLPQFKKENSIDVVIANGENSAVGNGVSPFSADFLFDSGVDIITLGNHTYKRKEIYGYLDQKDMIIRPANFPNSCPGKGCCIYDGGSFSLLVINIQGTAFMEPIDNPFNTVDRIIEQNPNRTIIVDFHAEATGEKKAMGYHLDGRVSLMVGTHTHIQTADAQILPNQTGYITDVGMTGPVNSVLGVTPECIINRYLTHLPTRFEVAQGKCQLNGVIAEIDEKTNKCIKIASVNLT